MAALDFPSPAYPGHVYAPTGINKSWIWDGVQWLTTTGGGASVTVSEAAPQNPSEGDLWYDSTNGILSVYYVDGDSSQWVDVGAGGGGGGGGSNVTVSATAPSSPSEGDLWFDENSGIMYMWYTDGSSNQWVDVGGGDSGSSAGAVNGIVKADGAGNFSTAVAGTDYLTASTFTGGSNSLASTGYQVFPGGLAIQWGGNYNPGTTSSTVTFPTAFTNTYRVIVGTSAEPGDTNGGDSAASVIRNTITTTGFDVSHRSITDWGYQWLAIGRII